MRKATDPITDELVRGSKIAWAAELRAERAEAEAERLRAAVQLALDFHGANTEAFVARYGHGITTRDLCDRLRELLAHHPTPQAGEQEQP